MNVRPDVDDGAATFSVNLLHHLPRAIPEMRFVAFVQSGETRIVESSNLRLVTVPRTRRARRVVRDTLWLRRELARVGADALISPHESLPFRSPCPVVVVAQNLLYHCDQADVYRGLPVSERLLGAVRSAYYRRRMPAAYAAAAKVVVVSAAFAAILQRRAGLLPDKTHVVREGSDSILLPGPSPSAGRAPVLLTVGSIAPYKELERMVDLFAEVRDAVPGLRLVIGGPDWRGYAEVLRRHIASRGLQDAVMLPGAFEARELAEHYASAKLFLLFSKCESFGLPALEAMRYGLPVAVSAHAALPEIVGDAGLVLDADSKDAGVLLRNLLTDERRLTEYGDAGKARASELTWSRTALRMADVVRAVVDPLGR
jgi:glycosyltransferase involved in cell wall biosynthesis